MSGLSPLARQHDRRTDEITLRKPWGLLLHTTGGGVPARAATLGRSAVDVALAWYRRSQDGANGYPWGGPTYVLGHDGAVHQIADESIVTNHAGGPHRSSYLTGAWAVSVPPAMVTAWMRQ